MNGILTFFWFGYFSLAPLAWIPTPWIAPSSLYEIKLGLIGLAVAITWIKILLNNRFRLPQGIIGPSGFVIMFVLAVPGFMQAENVGVAISRYTDIILGFVVLWTIYMYSNSGRNIMGPLYYAAIMVGAFCVVTVMASRFEALNFHAPSLFENRSITEIGFGGKRGNWSNGVALYLMPLLYGLKEKQRGIILRTVLVICIAAIIGSQFLVSGRTGLLASLFLLSCFLFYISKNYKLIAVLAISILIFLVFSDFEIANIFYEQFRLKNIERAGSEANTLETINALSTGRVAQFSMTLSLIADSPLTGHGFGRSVYGMDVHNLWLRLGFESGVLFPLFFAAVVLRIVLIKRETYPISKEQKDQSFHVDEGKSDFFGLCKYTIYAGILMSMLQPNVIMGSFQVTAIWWVVAGILAQKANTPRFRAKPL